MKNFTLIAAGALFLTSSALHAQFPVITATNQIPAVDDSIHYVDANTFGFDPDGSGGAIDVEWDYTGLTNAGTTIDFWYVDPTTTIEAANFPTATVAMVNSVAADGYEYFGTTANSISRMGYTSVSANSIYYDQDWNRYEFPITPGVNWSSMYTGTMTSLGAGEDSVTIAAGNYQATPDQYGTLTLPASQFGGQPEVFDDVVRVHVIESFQIKAWMFGTPVITITINDDYYFYFDEETKEPILIYGVTTDDGGGAPQTVLRYQPVPGTGTGGSAVLVSSIAVDGASGSSTITTPTGSLQMNVAVLPVNADDNTITWSVANGTGSASINASGLLTALTDGTVTVTASANDASGVIGTKIITVSNQSSSIFETNNDNLFTVYPNPSNGLFNIKLVNDYNSGTSVTVRNLLGQTVYSKIETSTVFSLNLTQMNSGVYFVSIENNGNKVTKKVTIK